MARFPTERLTRREREIMSAVFALGNRASAEEIRARLANPPTNSSLRVMLARLEKKGHLKHQQDGPRYMFSATVSPRTANRAALRDYVNVFFRGSLAQMVTSLVRDESWTDDELAAIETEIDRIRKERKSHE
jgi:predicted transcriptional regulator